MYEKLVCDGCNAQMEIGEMAYVLMGGDVAEMELNEAQPMTRKERNQYRSKEGR